MDRIPLDQLALQVAMLCQECSFSGGLLYSALEKPMEALKTGRAPRALNIELLLEEIEEVSQVLRESRDDLARLTPQFENYAQELGDKNLLDEVPKLQQECQFWDGFLERSQLLTKKLKLIAELEKLSPLGRAPIQDAWEEVQILAKPPA